MLNKKQILRKMALISLAVALTAAAAVYLFYSLEQGDRAKRKAEQESREEALVNRYRTYLEETAKKITRLPVDPILIGQIQSYYFAEHPQAHLYLWAADPHGEFLFGIPSEAFGLLNRAYDRFRPSIEKEGRFLDRQDFLRRLVHNHRQIDFEKLEAANAGKEPPLNELKHILRYAGAEDRIFSIPFLSESGQMLGNFYLKIADLPANDYYRRDEAPLVLSTLTLFFSLLFLWFLLPSWAYLDARGRGMDHPIRWAFLIMVSFLFGLTVYLILRPDEAGDARCRSCGRSMQGGRYCPFCGVVNVNEICAACGSPIRSEWTFCPNCHTENKRELPEKTGSEGVLPENPEADNRRPPSGD